MSDEVYAPENGQQHEAPVVRIIGARLNLDGGNYAMLEHGIIQVFLKDDRQLFSVDANSIPFERKILGSVLQVYLLGFQNGRAHERASSKQRLITAINLLYE
jgi:hypothetical protein